MNRDRMRGISSRAIIQLILNGPLATVRPLSPFLLVLCLYFECKSINGTISILKEEGVFEGPSEQIS